MSTLFCTGTLFSNWQELITTIRSSDTSICYENSDLSALADEICQQQYPELDEFNRIPFDVDNHHLANARRLTINKPDESILIWSDNNICLNLDFWKDANKETRFLLFFSSPEFDLSNYIGERFFDAAQINQVIAAWAHRAQAMLTFFMNNREQCRLINVEAAYSKHEEFLHLVTDFANLDPKQTSLTPTLIKKHPAQIKYLATTLLLNNQHISEIYDEIRSTASMLADDEKSIPDTEERSKTLVSDFLDEVATNKQLADSISEIEDELSLGYLQISQMQEELEYYFKKSTELETSTEAMADYLHNDPLLKIARQVRKA